MQVSIKVDFKRMMNAFDARSLTSNNNKINIYTNNRYFKITNDFSTVAC